MTTYNATAQREGRWWVVEVDGLGATQGRSVAEAEEMAADLVATMTDAPIEDVEVDVQFALPAGVQHEIEVARHANERAVEAQNDAAKRLRAAVTELKHVGMTGKDVAAILRISPQRVSQLVRH